MLFLLEQTLKTIKKHIGINLVITLTLFVAYLFFFIICCYIEDGMLGMTSFLLKDKERSVHYYGSVLGNSSSLDLQEIENFSNQYPFIEDITAIEYNYYSDPLTNQGGVFYRVDEHFFSHFTVPILRGRTFTPQEFQSGAPVCVIGEGFWLRSGMDIGDHFTVGGCELEIIGVMKYNANMSANLVPYKTFDLHNIPNLSIQGYEIVATLTDLSFASQINWSELGLLGEPVSGTDYFNNGLSLLFQRSSMFFFVGILVLVYALMNLLNIMINKMDQQQKSLGIRIALGAPYRKVFLQFFLESLILVMTAVLLIFCCDPLIEILMRGFLNHYFGPFTLLMMLIMSIVTSFCLSLVLFRKFKQVRITKIVKGV